MNGVPVSEPVAVRGECDGGHGEDEDDHAEGGVVDAHCRGPDQLLEVLYGRCVWLVFEFQYQLQCHMILIT